MTLFFLLISCIHYEHLQNYDELIQLICEGKSIKYSIIGHLKGYLLKDNDNIDGRDLYGKVDDLKSKKVGIIKGAYVRPGQFVNLIIYKKLNDILRDLRNHKLDAIIVDDGACITPKLLATVLLYLKVFLGLIMLALHFNW